MKISVKRVLLKFLAFDTISRLVEDFRSTTLSRRFPSIRILPILYVHTISAPFTLISLNICSQQFLSYAFLSSALFLFFFLQSGNYDILFSEFHVLDLFHYILHHHVALNVAVLVQSAKLLLKQFIAAFQVFDTVQQSLDDFSRIIQFFSQCVRD